MTAITEDANRPSKEIDLKSYPLAAVKVPKGALVSINSSGYATNASDSASDLGVAGVADEDVDNSGGSAGSQKIRVRSGRAFLFIATSITQAMVGTVMYVVDNNTIDDAAGATNDVAAGILVEYVSATQGWVFIPEGGAFAIEAGVDNPAA